VGTETFKTLREQIKFELGERTDLSTHTDLGDLYGKWINLAYLTITTTDSIQGVRGHLYFPELMVEDTTQSTADGTQTLTTPTDAIYIEGICDTTNDIELENISWTEYKSYTGRNDSNAEAKPTEWTRRGSSLYLYPTPDATYACTIYYKKKPAVLTGTNATVIGAEWDEAILKLAVIFGLTKLKRYEEAAIEKKAWTQYMYGLVGMYDKEKKDRDKQLRIHVYDRNYNFR